METPLATFRTEFQSLLLDFLWRQWSALGVAGQARPEDRWVLDPEALLLFTCTLGRHDPRLFDEVLDWLAINGRFLNVTRLKRMVRLEEFSGGQVLAAVAASLAKGTETLKWKQLAGRETGTVGPAVERLFFAPEGKPLPVLGEPEPDFLSRGFERGPVRRRGYSQPFPATLNAGLGLQLRALFGVTARCEILLYLLTHESAHPSVIARDAGYFPRAIQDTLVDMQQSGVVQLRPIGRTKHYWLHADQWLALLGRAAQPPPQWVTWAPFFSALEQIWLALGDEELLRLRDPLLLASEVRRLQAQVRPALQRAGFDKGLSDERNYLGESYLPVFLGDLRRCLL